MAIRRDITGMRSGKLVAIAPHHTNGRKWFWTVQCDCGTEKPVPAHKIIEGLIVSCGCGPRRGGDSTGRRKWFDGAVQSRTYSSWASMLERCTNPKSHHWEYYGATGITVCERWRSFGAFLEDMGECPPAKTIDRWPDPYGNYEPGNCRWVTMKEQAQNRRPWGTVAAKKFPKNFPGKI